MIMNNLYIIIPTQIAIIMILFPMPSLLDQVLPSKVGTEAGEGVFARTALAKATTVCLYSGLTMTRVSPTKTKTILTKTN